MVFFVLFRVRNYLYDILLWTVVQELEVYGMQVHPQNFDLLKIWAKSQNIWAQKFRHFQQ